MRGVRPGAKGRVSVPMGKSFRAHRQKVQKRGEYGPVGMAPERASLTAFATPGQWTSPLFPGRRASDVDDVNALFGECL